MRQLLFTRWTTWSGTIGRREYWLGYLVPAAVFITFSEEWLVPGLLGDLTLLVRLAGLWLFTLGSVKRIRDLGLPAGALIVTWWGGMGVALVIAVGVFLFGMLTALSGGGSELMEQAVWIVLAPIGILVLVAGGIPGPGASSDPPMPFRTRAKPILLAGVGMVTVGLAGFGIRDFFTHRDPALFRAIRSRDVERVNAVLERGADANQQTTGAGSYSLGMTPLAVEIGMPNINIDIVFALLDHGADPSGSPLAWAAWFGQVELVERMLVNLLQWIRYWEKVTGGVATMSTRLR